MKVDSDFLFNDSRNREPGWGGRVNAMFASFNRLRSRLQSLRVGLRTTCRAEHGSKRSRNSVRISNNQFSTINYQLFLPFLLCDRVDDAVHPVVLLLPVECHAQLLHNLPGGDVVFVCNRHDAVEVLF